MVARALPCLAIAALVSLAPPAIRAAEPTLDITRIMTPEEFQAAGLDKLEAAELEALNRWILQYTVRDAPQVRQHDPTVRQQVRGGDAGVLRSRILGSFRGWSGDTVFRLEDGQVWQQRLPGNYFHRAESPEVELRRNALGFWELRIVATNRAVGVKRIE